MDRFVIVADATCDLSEELEAKYGIVIVPGHIVLPDKTEVPAFRKWEMFSREEFYADLKKNPNGYATSPANVAEFAEVFEKYASEGTGILAMTISSGISGAYNFALQAKNPPTYPSRSSTSSASAPASG